MSNTDQTSPQPPYQAPQQPYAPSTTFTAPEYYQPAPRPTAPPFAELSFDEQRTYAATVHFASFVAGPAGAAFGYLLLRGRGGLIRQHAATALNFQLSLAIYSIVLSLIAFVPVLNVLVALAFLTLRVIYFILPAKQAYRGELAKLPLSIKFVR
jgi:uncharacterized Tic20 family protein